jgi:hypothetical protein
VIGAQRESCVEHFLSCLRFIAAQNDRCHRIDAKLAAKFGASCAWIDRNGIRSNRCARPASTISARSHRVVTA